MSKNRQKGELRSILSSPVHSFFAGGKSLQIACFLALMLVLVVSSPTAATAPVDFPEKGKPITIIVDSPPGGTSDMTARLIAPVLEKELGTPVQVVNKPGGGGQVGITEAARAKPDGYTLLVVSLPDFINNYMDPDRNPIPLIREMVPVALHNLDVTAVIVNAESPYRTIKDLVDAAKANPGGLKVSTGALLGVDHLFTIYFMKKTGTNFRFVHFNGGSPATAAVAGGHVDARVGKVGGIYAMMKSGKVRVIGVMDKQRSRFCPDAPTLEEAGYKDMVLYQVSGVAAPKGTPRAIIDILSNGIKQAVDSEDSKKRLEGVGLSGRFMGPDELAAYWKNAEVMMEPLLLDAKKAAKK